MKAWDPGFERRLLEASDYRTFASWFFKNGDRDWTAPVPLTFGSFSERSGFKAKSFMNDVLAGRKRLTPHSVDRVAAGLGLDSQWQEYFRSLVALEEDAFHTRLQPRSYFEDRVATIRAKLAKRASRRTFSEEQLSLVEVFLAPDFPQVYASLGDTEVGANLSSISARASLPRERVKAVLEKMQEVSLVKYDRHSGHYLPCVSALNARDLRSSRVFRQDMLRSLETAKDRLRTQCDSGSSLFMTQTFSVSRKSLPQLKKRLAELLESFTINSEEAEGDGVADLCVSFTHNQD